MSLENRLANWAIKLRSAADVPLRIELWNGKRIDLSSAAPRVTVRLPSAATARYLLMPSLSSLGGAYVEGDIEVSGQAVDMIAIVNQLASTQLSAVGRLGRMVRSLSHDKRSDAKAIRYHYDVSNTFYAGFLDAGMVYSCAYFEDGNETLGAAQIKKIDLILKKIRLQPGQTLLDIGCGWGALAIRAAQLYGARCVGVTLSENQAALATERVAAAGVAHLVEIRLQDYRDVRGQFDRITSVGMFEHVGLRNLGEYFSIVGKLLAPGGVVMNHGITSTDAANGESPYGGGEFIERYVFPQGELAHIGHVLKVMQESGLEVQDVENLRRHYARTCALWSANFETNQAEMQRLGGARRFRIWRVYLAGCSYAFEHDWISLYQIVCSKAGLSAATLPWSRNSAQSAALLAI
ncbi:cyclopropane-fatty-acyl-phospholipid synthase family protein [Massilia sp. S19_KUP03_FR1]|uniref:cyclopropane-fatty-acyl-phospholipid synthase family protein n=1 Tax=Massilia sp. S19_KUP03_FR1 TaxID=3025503 RepID=UPI002FCD97D7